jgi:hypothetical protein
MVCVTRFSLSRISGVELIDENGHADRRARARLVPGFITLSIICETRPTFGQDDQTSSAEQKSNEFPGQFPGRCKKQIF